MTTPELDPSTYLVGIVVVSHSRALARAASEEEQRVRLRLVADGGQHDNVE